MGFRDRSSVRRVIRARASVHHMDARFFFVLSTSISHFLFLSYSSPFFFLSFSLASSFLICSAFLFFLSAWSAAAHCLCTHAATFLPLFDLLAIALLVFRSLFLLASRAASFAASSHRAVVLVLPLFSLECTPQSAAACSAITLLRQLSVCRFLLFLFLSIDSRFNIMRIR